MSARVVTDSTYSTYRTVRYDTSIADERVHDQCYNYYCVCRQVVTSSLAQTATDGEYRLCAKFMGHSTAVQAKHYYLTTQVSPRELSVLNIYRRRNGDKLLRVLRRETGKIASFQIILEMERERERARVRCVFSGTLMCLTTVGRDC